MPGSMRSVVIESGTWRWARRTSPGHEILGNGRRLALDKLFFKSASALVPMFRRYAIKNP